MKPIRARDLKLLIESSHPLIAIESPEEERARDLVFMAARELSLPVIEWSITKGFTSIDRPMLVSAEDPFIALQYIKDYAGNAIFLLKDFAHHLKDPSPIRQMREAAQVVSKRGSTIVLTGTAIDLPAELKHKAIFYELKLPTREDYKALAASIYEAHMQKKRTTWNMTSEDYDAMIDALSGLTLKQARQAISYALSENDQFDRGDIELILKRKMKQLSEESPLEFYPPSQLAFQLGGFNRLKAWLERAKSAFTPEAAAMNLKPPRGILIVGVPGCGKSLTAKFIASQWRLPLLKLDASKMYDKFVGESERKFRRATATAEAMAPSILWIDEIEKGFNPSSGASTDGGLSQRLFGAFLTWLQEKSGAVFVIATANDLLSLPPELTRKGRFDEVFFVDLPTRDERFEILKIQLKIRGQMLADDQLSMLADQSVGFSGAEIEQAVVSALLQSIHSKRSLDVKLISDELLATRPLSVSRAEDIARIRQECSSRFVPVN